MSFNLYFRSRGTDKKATSETAEKASKTRAPHGLAAGLSHRIAVGLPAPSAIEHGLFEDGCQCCGFIKPIRGDLSRSGGAGWLWWSWTWGTRVLVSFSVDVYLVLNLFR